MSPCCAIAGWHTCINTMGHAASRYQAMVHERSDLPSGLKILWAHSTSLFCCCLQVCWAELVGAAPSQAHTTSGQTVLGSLTWLSGWPVALAMDRQGRIAAVNHAAQPLSIHACLSHASSHWSPASEGAQASCVAYNEWSSGHQEPSQSW